MRYVQSTVIRLFAGLLGGVLLTVPWLAIELVYANRVMLKRMAQCGTAMVAAGGGACDFYVQFSHAHYLGLTFVIGFAVTLVLTRKFTRVVIATSRR